ncbi:MAG: AAA family ATPase [Mycoplasmataceae bacterium]|nr:AAA family ATPase [Mycoplasmataceae bacterium]
MTSREYFDLLDGIKGGQSYFITGPAGTGKTHLMKAIYNSLKNDGEKIVLTSTTGSNALNLGGVTIHKLTGISIHTNKAYIGFMKTSFLYSGIKKRMQNIDIIVIDEVSMLRSDQFELIDELLKQVSGNQKPFGGKTLIFTGDFYQIPPVVRSWEKNKTQWLFDCQAWKDANIKNICLTKIHRQLDSRFSNFLNDIRVGIWKPEDKEIVKECESREVSDDSTTFFSTNEECEIRNKKKMDELPGEEKTYIAKVTGKRNKKYAHEKEAIVKDVIAKYELHLKVGADVIVVANDVNSRYANGTQGVVQELGEKYVIIKTNDDKLLRITPFVWKKVDIKNKVLAKFEQIPLLLSYALTIHKAQGMTLEKAVVDCKNIFACGQLYVAVSRVKKLENLKMLNFHEKQIMVSKDVTDFYARLERQMRNKSETF